MDKKAFLLECYKYEIIKFGEFQLKSGIISPFYVDLRPLASVPEILENLGKFLLEIIPKDSFELICGVPYAALPMATAMSLQSRIPLIIKRKETKKYGTKKNLEGIYKEGQSCLVVEDVITSGQSLLETVPEIEKEGLKVKHIIAVLDREQGGVKRLEDHGYKVSILFTISEICKILLEENLISQEQFLKIEKFLYENKNTKPNQTKRLSYEEKSQKTQHLFAKNLLDLAVKKKSNLIVSADVTTSDALLKLADETGPHIIALKTHIDIISDFSQKTIFDLKSIAKKHNFYIMEDRKFADIGNTQKLQFSGGIYKISGWADFVTSHIIGGEKSLNAFGETPVCAILSMSSEGTLADEEYLQKAQVIAEKHDCIFGGVSQYNLSDKLLHFVPGVNLESGADGKGQQYNTPETAFSKIGADFIIVGRGIYSDENPANMAKVYKNVSWKAYEDSIEQINS